MFRRNISTYEQNAKGFGFRRSKRLGSIILTYVKYYAYILAKLITNPKFKKIIRRLEHTSIEGVRLQAHEIEELLKDLNHMLYVLDLYIKELRELIENHSGTGQYKGKQIIIALIHLLDKKKKKLGKEYSIAENIREMIRRRMHQFNNKADQLTLMIDQKFGGKKGELRKEFQVVLHTEKELKELTISEKHLEGFLK